MKISIVQEGNVLRSRDGQGSLGVEQVTGFNRDCQAPASQGLGIRDITLQLSPGLSQWLQRGQSVPEKETIASAPPITARSMPEDLLANPELPSLLTLHPDEIFAPQSSTTRAAARWKKGNVAVAANRFLKGVLAPKPTESDLGTLAAAGPKKRKKPRKVCLFVLSVHTLPCWRAARSTHPAVSLFHRTCLSQNLI